MADLHDYYLRELDFIRKLSQEFARDYPETAGRLLLRDDRQADDPHVERLLEGFALLAGRIRHKLDDEFPELTDALFSVLYPHYLAPIPSLALIQIEPNLAGSDLSKGFLVPRHTPLRTEAVDGLRCRFRTAYPVTLWPIALQAARLQPPPFALPLQPPPDTASALRLELHCTAADGFAGLSLDALRLHLAGDSALVADLYELICNDTLAVTFRGMDGKEPRPDPIVVAHPNRVPDCIVPVGFGEEEGLLPYPPHALPGYRLLTEFFAYPAKFHFIDLTGWQRVAKAGFAQRLEVIFYLRRTLPGREHTVSAANFRLGCTPIVNLFPQIVEPRALDQTLPEYSLLPDADHPRGMEVYAVDTVSAVDDAKTRQYRPFYSYHHGAARGDERAFWYAARRPAPRRHAPTGDEDDDDGGTVINLTLVDLDFQPLSTVSPTLVVRTLCTNRNLPAQLGRAGQAIDFELDLAGPVSRITCLRTPTRSLQAPARPGTYWRLVSHLTLNHLSLTDGVEAIHALREMLRLYDFTAGAGVRQREAVAEQAIEGLTGVSSRRTVGRLPGSGGNGFCRGVEICIELDESKYVGTGAFLFASVLERFFALHVSLNSFTETLAATRQRKELLRRWPPRAGYQPLV